MSEKKHQKSIEELCRSRMSRMAGGEKWPPLSEKSSHNILPRSPSPRESFSRSRRRSETTRHSLLSGRPLSTDHRACPKQNMHEAATEKRKKMYQGVQEQVKKTPFFPGISTQIVTHADPPFPATDTQPLPPINMPRGQEYPLNALKQGKDSRPFTIYGQLPFENGSSAYDIAFSATEERASKRKLEALKRVEEQERLHAYSVSKQQSESKGKKKCLGAKRSKKGTRKFTKPLAWKSPWPEQDTRDLSDMETDWTDIN